MALKINCHNCSKEIICESYEVGDEICCPNCLSYMTIPKEAYKVQAESMLLYKNQKEDREYLIINKDVNMAIHQLLDVWNYINKLTNYGAFNSPEAALNYTGLLPSEFENLICSLKQPEQVILEHNDNNGLKIVAYLRGRLYALMPNYKKAILEYKKCLQYRDTNEWYANVYYLMGITHEVNDKYTLALECYQKIKNEIGFADDEMKEDITKRIEEIDARKSSCFIATAVYGSSQSTEVVCLKMFRNQVLMNFSLGLRFIRVYNKISPPIAKLIQQRKSLRLIVRTFIIKPLIIFIKVLLSIYRNDNSIGRI